MELFSGIQDYLTNLYNFALWSVVLSGLNSLLLLIILVLVTILELREGKENK